MDGAFSNESKDPQQYRIMTTTLLSVNVVILATVFVVSISPVQALDTSSYNSDLADNEELNEQESTFGDNQELKEQDSAVEFNEGLEDSQGYNEEL